MEGSKITTLYWDKEKYNTTFEFAQAAVELAKEKQENITIKNYKNLNLSLVVFPTSHPVDISTILALKFQMAELYRSFNDPVYGGSFFDLK